MASVTDISEYEGREIIAALVDLLERAHQGRLRGLAFAVKTGPRKHRLGITGDYYRDPYDALGCVTRMEYKLNQLISARDDEPDTSTMPL